MIYLLKSNWYQYRLISGMDWIFFCAFCLSVYDFLLKKIYWTVQKSSYHYVSIILLSKVKMSRSKININSVQQSICLFVVKYIFLSRSKIQVVKVKNKHSYECFFHMWCLLKSNWFRLKFWGMDWIFFCAFCLYVYDFLLLKIKVEKSSYQRKSTIFYRMSTCLDLELISNLKRVFMSSL